MLRSEQLIGSPLFFSLVPLRYRFTPRTSEKQKQRHTNYRWLITSTLMRWKQLCYCFALDADFWLFPQWQTSKQKRD